MFAIVLALIALALFFI